MTNVSHELMQNIINRIEERLSDNKNLIDSSKVELIAVRESLRAVNLDISNLYNMMKSIDGSLQRLEVKLDLENLDGGDKV